MPLFRLIKGNLSLLVMFFFAGCFFLSSILAKKILNDESFYQYNLLTTIFSMSFTFCFLGSEQLFLRLGKAYNSKYHISYKVIKLMLITCILFVFVCFFCLRGTFFEEAHSFYFLFIPLFSALFIFTYNFLRVQHQFFLAQIINNLWKSGLLIAVIFSLAYEFYFVSNVLLTLVMLFSLFMLYVNRDSLIINDEALPKNWKQLFLGFSLSLFVLLLINNLDRLVVESYLSKNAFAGYVYLITLLIMPFSILSSYYGFKEVAFLKVKYKKQEFERKLVKVSLISFSLYLVWFFIIYSLRTHIEIAVEIEFLIPCLIIVVFKSSYSLVSSLFGLKSSFREMLLVNISTLLIVFLLFSLVIKLGVSYLYLLYSMAGVWLFRFFIFYFQTRKVAEYEI